MNRVTDPDGLADRWMRSLNKDWLRGREVSVFDGGTGGKSVYWCTEGKEAH